MKITFPELTALVAETSGLSKRKSEDFLKSLFNTLSQALEDGESVKVPQLGTFKLVTIDARKSVNVTTGEEMEIPAHRRVSFVPSKEIAQAINSPFSAFEAVELSDSVSDEDLAAVETEETLITASPAIPQITPPVKEEITELPESELTTEVMEEQTVEKPTVEVKEAAIPELPATSYEKTEDETLPELQQEEAATPSTIIPRKKSHFWIGLFTGVAAVVLLIVGIFWADYAFNKSQFTSALVSHKGKATTRQESQTNPGEGLEQDMRPGSMMGSGVNNDEPPTPPETEASDQAPVYDKITKTRYLTTMARDHYGNYNLWPYIYIENQSKLGHPDRIKPGTEIVIPDLSKYGVDAYNPADIETAKKKGAEIYARWNNR